MPSRKMSEKLAEMSADSTQQEDDLAAVRFMLSGCVPLRSATGPPVVPPSLRCLTGGARKDRGGTRSLPEVIDREPLQPSHLHTFGQLSQCLMVVSRAVMCFKLIKKIKLKQKVVGKAK